MKTNKGLRLCALGLLTALVWALPATAQDWAGRARIQGIVTTEDGKPIEGAKVLIYRGGDKTKGPAAVTTDAKGRWNALGLASGSWSVLISKEGFVPSQGSMRLSEVALNESLKVSLQNWQDTEEAKQAKGIIGDLEKANNFMREGKWGEARGLYEKVLPEVNDQSKPGIQLGIAQCQVQEKDYAAALTTLAPVLVATPEDLSALKLQAAAQGQLGKTDDALTTLKQIVEVNPEDVDALQLIVNLLITAGREVEAETYSARMPAGAEIDPSALLNRGIEKYNGGDVDGALIYFEKAVKQNDKIAEVYYYRGLAYLAKERIEDAKADLKKFLELGPDHPNAAQAREFLKEL